MIIWRGEKNKKKKVLGYYDEPWTAQGDSASTLENLQLFRKKKGELENYERDAFNLDNDLRSHDAVNNTEEATTLAAWYPFKTFYP